MKKKNVLIIAANDMGNSGVPGVFMEIVRNLKDEYNFDIVLTREGYYYKNEFESYGGKIYLIKEAKAKNKIVRACWRLFGNIRQIKKGLKTILSNKNYEIVHSFKESDSWIYLKEAKKYGVKKRIIHNNRRREVADSFLINLYTNLSIKKSVKLSNCNISVSGQAGKSFFGKANFKVIYNTYNEAKYYYRLNNSKKGELSLLQIGTFLPLKNQLFSLEVASLLKNKYPSLKVFFVGHVFDDGYFKEFMRRITHLELEHNVEIFDGNLDQTELLDKATFTVMPSISEGLSLVSIESQACGITVFASQGVPLEVNVGNMIYLPLEPQTWADTISVMFEKYDNKRKEINAQKFSKKEFVSKITAIYN